jgi:hypothetical protein
MRDVKGVIAVGLAVVCGLFVAGASAAPASFTLRFDGVHVADSSLPAGIRHEGRFTASAPFCPAGHAVDAQDVEIEPLTVMRTFTCDDGSGSVTAFLPAIAAEHGGIGTWKIVSGTGRYEALRGIGTYAGRLVSGDPSVFETIVFTTAWQGVVDFDTAAPTITATASAKKLRKPPRTYTIRTSVDAHEGPVTYSVDIRAGKAYLALRQGTLATGRAIVASRIRAPKGVRRVTVTITVADVVGNTSTKTLSVRVR